MRAPGHSRATSRTYPVSAMAEKPDLKKNGTVGNMGLLLRMPTGDLTDGPSSGKASNQAKRTTTTGSVKTRTSKEKVAIAEDNTVIVIQPDGRVCKICKVKDIEIDYVNGLIYIRWAKPPQFMKEKNAYVNDGLVCFYCEKLHRAQFKARPNMATTDALVLAMGHPKGGAELTKEFNQFRELLVQACIDQQKYNVRIDMSRVR